MSTFQPRVVKAFLPLALATALLLAPGLRIEAAEPVEVTFLANEGVMIRSGKDAVVIDAFVGEPYSQYGHLPDDGLRKLLDGKEPFDTVRLALVSHVHRDHVQPEVAVPWLAARRDRTIASSEQVLDALRKADDGLDEQLQELWPEPGKVATLKSGSIEVQAFRLSHGSGRFAGIQNLGQVITVGGKRFLHVGDAAMELANFEPFEKLLTEVDVALLPYWYWYEEPGRKLIARWFAGIPKVALHLPPAEAEAFVGRVAEDDANVSVFGKSLDSIGF